MSMDGRPGVISVIVPVYKVEAYLAECVNSILSQSYQNLEVVLVDDGSPDNCPAICDAAADRDSRVKTVHQENRGLAEARNAGLDVATGEYVMFCDSDDYLPKDACERLIDKAVECSADVVLGSWTVVDDAGETISSLEIYEDKARKRLQLVEVVTATSRLYKRTFLRSRGIRFEHCMVGEDMLYCTKLFLCNPKLETIPGSVYNYRRRGDIQNPSLTMLRDEKAISSFVESRTMALEMAQKAENRSLVRYFALRFPTILSQWREAECVESRKNLFKMVKRYAELFCERKERALIGWWCRMPYHRFLATPEEAFAEHDKRRARNAVIASALAGDMGLGQVMQLMKTTPAEGLCCFAAWREYKRLLSLERTARHGGS